MIRSMTFIVLILLASAPGAPTQKQRFQPGCLLEDAKYGVTFFTPEGFLPNPEEALKRKARSCWYGATSIYQHWGFFTFHRPDQEQGMDPTYWTEVLKARWGKAEAPPKKVSLPEGDGLELSFLLTEGNQSWALQTVLVPAGAGVFDLTFFGPPRSRAALARFAEAAARTVRVYPPPQVRSYTLACGVGFRLPEDWKPVRTPTDGSVFQAFQRDGKYAVTLSLTGKVADPEAALRTRCGQPRDQGKDFETVSVPAGSMLVSWGTDAAPPIHALIPLDTSALAVTAVLPRTGARDRFLELARSLSVLAPSELDRDVRKLASSLRSRTRVSRLSLRPHLQELARFAGHPLAAEALLPLLTRGNDEVVIETAVFAATLAPFGPSAEALADPLARAVKKSRFPQAAAILRALGRSQDPAAVALIAPHLDSKDLGLAHAAVDAMGHLPFGDGSAMEAVITLYARLGESSRASRGATRGSTRDDNRFKLLYYPILTALRRQSGRDFPYPEGIELARTWLKNRRGKT